jgi:hypothetical protein
MISTQYLLFEKHRCLFSDLDKRNILRCLEAYPNILKEFETFICKMPELSCYSDDFQL